MRTQPPTAQIGSLEIFWPLIEPILNDLQPRRICEIGVAAGALTNRLLAWAEQRACAYIGIDPAPDASVIKRFAASSGRPDRRLLLQTSHASLPNLERCDVYFIDGDHNYFTVHGELKSIANSALNKTSQSRGPAIFMHDVGWPWGRRDMYYLPTTVPPEARQPWSETLGVPLDGEELIEGGLREPGRYAIACQPGGPRNGVLTAVEDFLSGADGADWKSIILPAAYGLAVLYRPADSTLSTACPERFDDLQKMATTGGAFLQTCEENYLRLYLYGEYHRHAAVTESAAHHATLAAYDGLQRSYDELLAHNRAKEQAYQDLLAHSTALEGEYQKLLAAYEQLRAGVATNDGPPQSAPPDD